MQLASAAEPNRRSGDLKREQSTSAMPSIAFNLSLRTKGLFAFAALVLYLACVAALVEQQRARLSAVVVELTAVYQLDETMMRAHMAAAHAITGANDAMLSSTRDAAVAGLLVDVDELRVSLATLARILPGTRALTDRLDEAIQDVKLQASVRSLGNLRDVLYRAADDVAAFTAQIRSRESGLMRTYERIYDSITRMSLVLGMVGIAVFGALITLFFTRLASDIKRLEQRSTEIVAGKRGAPMPVTRRDELGALMRAVNGMADQLDQREHALDLSRRNYAHQEKMAAIGSLAAGIAHEIGNPIAAISGVAQSICDVRASSHCPNKGVVCQPEMILAQTKRIAAITREISDFAAPRPVVRELMDLNSLIRSTCSFMRYDRRYRHIDLVLDLDSQLPAVHAVADHVAQVVMNLMINAADAVESTPGRKPQVTVVTRYKGDVVRLSVQDNGCGMSAEVKRRVFEPFFTTKGSGKGTGLGLSLCRSLVDGMGGTIEFESHAGQGTSMHVELTRPKSAAVSG